MEQLITSEDALRVWSARLREPETDRRHVATSELYELVMHQLSPPDAETILAHLRHCQTCHAEWRVLVWDITAADMTDKVHIHAAATQGPLGLIEVQTKAGHYTILVRPSASPGEAAIITLEVNHSEARERLTGQMIRLTTPQGRILLQGEIVAGEVSQYLDAPLTRAELEEAVVDLVEPS